MTTPTTVHHPPVRPPWLITAEAEIGIKEIPGPSDHPRILEYHQFTSYQAESDEVSWCSSFVNWSLAMSMGISSHKEWSLDIPGTGKANARSWMDWGREMAIPAHGAITVLWSGSKKNDWRGHVGFLVGIDRFNVWLLGGNQSNSVMVSPYSVERVLGFRWRE